ncbi:hypothetical protein [Pseudomonas jinjuensis]|uniref:hypothetical protein n=1 Tax=Pseudomonas jinjuensis TaxID=198616 RepID=UPI001C31BC4E
MEARHVLPAELCLGAAQPGDIQHWLIDIQWMSVLCISLMAGFGFATVSPIQKLVLDKAAAAGAPTLAAAVNIGLFNLGNAIGAW